VKAEIDIEDRFPLGIEYDQLFDEQELGDFQIGQSYEERFAKTLVCKKCGSKRFIVGIDAYFTAVKCENCEYQICIHDG